MRGAARHDSNSNGSTGIIPARAGSSAPILGNAASSRDHPRACGEQSRHSCRRPAPRGSSPRVRGAVSSTFLVPRSAGIIPARAGSRAARSYITARTWDHPRACGEQSFLRQLIIVIVGSSPRVRGAELQSVRPALRDGIIPARAGSRRPMRGCSSHDRDHPRACGEQHPFGFLLQHRQGSSPRVRGAGVCRYRYHQRYRIIPARAGSSM